MGLFRTMTSVGAAGTPADVATTSATAAVPTAVDFRSDKERAARNTGKAAKQGEEADYVAQAADAGHSAGTARRLVPGRRAERHAALVRRHDLD